MQEELLPLFDRVPFVFDRERGAYRCLRHDTLFAATTGPGLSRGGAIRKLFTDLAPHFIINAGLVGLLKEDPHIKAGDRLRVGEVVDMDSGTVYPGGPGRDRLVTVRAPVFEPQDKMDLALRFRAQACDMEAARVIRTAGQIQEVAGGSVVLLCKVVGDRPDSYNLFKHEHLVRGWHRKSRWQKLWTGLRFPGGPGRLRELLEMKHTGLSSLAAALEGLIEDLYAHRGPPPGCDGLFIPH